MTDLELQLTVENARLYEELSRLRHVIEAQAIALNQLKGDKTRGEGGFGSSGR